MVTLSIIFAVVFVTTIAHAMYLGRKLDMKKKHVASLQIQTENTKRTPRLHCHAGIVRNKRKDNTLWKYLQW